MSDIRRRAIEGLRPGDTFTVARTFDEGIVDAFGDLSRDFNPVHYDRRYAETKGFGDLIAHWLLVGSLVTEVGGQIGWLATSMSFRFLKPVFRRDTVTCQLTIDEIDERGRARATARLTDQHGTLVIEAALAGHLPLGRSRDALAAMVAEGDPTNGA
jgi:acyl dehydratase